MTLLSSFIAVIIVSHWFACMWALTGRSEQEAGRFSWIDAAEDGKSGSYNNEFRIYLAALHFTVMVSRCRSSPPITRRSASPDPDHGRVRRHSPLHYR
jgi:hypothetical protein